MADAGWYGLGTSARDLFTHFTLHSSRVSAVGAPWELLLSSSSLASRPSVAIVLVVLGAVRPVASPMAMVVRVLAVAAVVLVRG